MIGRLIEIATDGVHLSVERGFMKIASGAEEIGRVAVDDISALIVHGHGATFSANLVSRLAERGAPVVICDNRHSPVALVWPMQGHYEQGLRMEAQAAAALPLRKRLWRDLVKAKIVAQADALQAVGENGDPLRDMSRRVRSGDSDNIEAQAARRYWQRMMGTDFRRDRGREGINSMLNYAYMVLRAGAARAILGAGLHPSLSLHHTSRGNAFRLADDIMEPFRPYADLLVCQLATDDAKTLNSDTKAKLAGLMTIDLSGPRGASPLQTCLDRCAVSLAQVFIGSRTDLELPGPALDLTLAAAIAR